MLILTRKPEQSIIIDGDIVVSVLAVDGDRVKIGIRAPADVAILREEIRREVGGENQRATVLTGERTTLAQSLRALRPMG